MGRYANQYPDDTRDDEDVRMLHIDEEHSNEEEYTSDFVFLQKDPKYKYIPSTWVLLDSCFKMSVFKTRSYMTNIRKSASNLTVLTNGGEQRSNEVADTKYFGQVWFNEGSMANIFSLADLYKYVRVTIDSSVKNSMFVHREDGGIMEFNQFKSGLYYFDIAEQTTNSYFSSDINYNYLPSFSSVQTVEDNKEKYTKR